MTMVPLAELLRWMAEMPPPFRGLPEGFPGGVVRVRAVVADLFESYFGGRPPSQTLDAFDPRNLGQPELNRLRLILAATHLLWHKAFRELAPSPALFERFLIQEIPTLSGVVAVEHLDQQEERREELIRRALAIFGCRLPSESSSEAEDRLRQVDSIERRRVMLAAAEREKRARKVREAMAKKAAEEAAAKVSRE